MAVLQRPHRREVVLEHVRGVRDLVPVQGDSRTEEAPLQLVFEVLRPGRDLRGAMANFSMKAVPWSWIFLFASLAFSREVTAALRESSVLPVASSSIRFFSAALKSMRLTFRRRLEPAFRTWLSGIDCMP